MCPQRQALAILEQIRHRYSASQRGRRQRMRVNRQTIALGTQGRRAHVIGVLMRQHDTCQALTARAFGVDDLQELLLFLRVDGARIEQKGGIVTDQIGVGMCPGRQGLGGRASPINLSRTDKAFVQAQLAARGLYSGPRDGKFGPKARDAIHAYQTQAGLRPADGFATPALVASLRAGR